MFSWITHASILFMGLLAATALFFFVFTRGALLWRSAVGGAGTPAAHVYPIYSNLRLIRLIDYQPIISAILLFQYSRLVSIITDGLHKMRLQDKDVLITSCAFGDVIPRVVGESLNRGARRVLIADIVGNELQHASQKLQAHADKLQLLQENAAALPLPDGSVQANVLFFLLHELPHPLKGAVLHEALRVVAPGGQLYLAEFHRPNPWVLRALSWTYFKVFEPYGLALWDTHDPLAQLEALGGLRCERRTVFFGNFQVIVATKDMPP